MMSVQGISKEYSFREACPVWEKGEELTKNHSLVFRGVIDGNEEINLRIASHARYQIFVDGVFFAGKVEQGEEVWINDKKILSQTNGAFAESFKLNIGENLFYIKSSKNKQQDVYIVNYLQNNTNNEFN